jgi:oligopeptide/dipeptide ABC transporter ATP-binding protein
MPPALLDVRNLRVRFDTPEGIVHAVEEVSFKLEAGETLGLVGESGSGKSVTALALLGLVGHAQGAIETGEVLYEGRDLLQLPPEELRKLRGDRISIVLQDPLRAFNPYLTLGRQLGEVLEAHSSLGRREARKRCLEALGEVGLADPERCLDSFPHELSGGMRQRAMVAMALLCRPRVLIADEPTTALDVTLQAQILELLRQLQREHGTAILLITHDLGVVASIAQRVHVMYGGRIVETSSTAELLQRPMHPYTLALLQCAPSLARPAGERLPALGGQPPDPLATLPGCAFRPRCGFAVARCESERPPLMAIQSLTGDVLLVGGRRSACFEMLRVGRSVPQPGALAQER